MTTSAEIERVTKYVQRARDLVRLAVDPAAAEAEGRTAAFAACKLIAANQLVITSPLLIDGHRHTEPPRPSASTSSGSWSAHSNNSAAPPGPRSIRVRYQSTCRVCGESIAVGGCAYWEQGRGVWHAHCDQGRA